LNHDQASSALFFLVGLLIALHSVSYALGTLAAPESGLMPFLAGAAIAVFAAIGFVHATLRRRAGEGWAPLLRAVRWERCLLTLLALAGFVLLLPAVGFLLDTGLFIGFLLRAIVPQRWPVVLLGAVFSAGGAYLVFQVWLQAQLPPGPLGF